MQAWADAGAACIMANARVVERKQAGGQKGYQDLAWPAMWGGHGTTDITDITISQRRAGEGHDAPCLMMNGGNCCPPLTDVSARSLLVRSSGGLTTLQQVLAEPHRYIAGAKQGSFLTDVDHPVAERVLLCYWVVFMPATAGAGSQEDIAVQTKFLNHHSLDDPHKVWLTQYGRTPIMGAAATPNTWQRHFMRDSAGAQKWVGITVTDVHADSGYGGLHMLPADERKKAVHAGLREEDDVVQMVQVPIAPHRKSTEMLSDPCAVDVVGDDAPVYRGCCGGGDDEEGAYLTKIGFGSDAEYSEEMAQLDHVRDPMFHVRAGHVRGIGEKCRVDIFKIIAVRGPLTDTIVDGASDWLHARNSGDLIPLESVVDAHIAHAEKLGLPHSMAAPKPRDYSSEGICRD